MRGAPRTVDLAAERARLDRILDAKQREIGRMAAVPGVFRRDVDDLLGEYKQTRREVLYRLKQLRRIERHRARTDAKRVSAAMAKELAAE